MEDVDRRESERSPKFGHPSLIDEKSKEIEQARLEMKHPKLWGSASSSRRGGNYRRTSNYDQEFDDLLSDDYQRWLEDAYGSSRPTSYADMSNPRPSTQNQFHGGVSQVYNSDYGRPDVSWTDHGQPMQQKKPLVSWAPNVEFIGQQDDDGAAAAQSQSGGHLGSKPQPYVEAGQSTFGSGYAAVDRPQNLATPGGTGTGQAEPPTAFWQKRPQMSSNAQSQVQSGHLKAPETAPAPANSGSGEASAYFASFR